MHISSNRRASVAVGALIALFASFLTVFASSASAQSKCGGDQSIDWTNRSITSGRGKGGVLSAAPMTGILAEPVPAGSYRIRTYSSEFKEDRASEEAQADESWTAVFLDAAGNEVGRTPYTTDVPDGVNLGESFDTFTISLTGTATNVRIDHKILDVASPANSVSPSCIGVTSLAAPAPTTAAPTTTAAPAPTTVASVLAQTTLPPTTAPPVTLPRTGNDDTQSLAVVAGCALVAVGIGLVSATRRRRELLV